jgi:outer membrane lipoprotein carrier protein
MTLAFLIALAAAAPDAGAPRPDAGILAKKVQAYYEKTQDFEATFTQTYTYTAFHRTQGSKGVLKVKKPGKIRFDYTLPAKKTVTLVGSRYLQYEPDENQVFVDEKFDSRQLSSAVTFLWGKGSLEKEFDLSLGEKGELVMKPKKEDGRIQQVVLEVTGDGEVASTAVTDASGNVNRLAFATAKRNAGIKDSEFELELPRDVHRLAPPGAAIPAPPPPAPGPPPK